MTSLENWRTVNYILQDIIILEMFLVAGYILARRSKVSDNFKYIINYLIFSVVFEIVSRVVLKINPNSIYFIYYNFLFIGVETWLLYMFLDKIHKKNGIIRKYLLLNVSLLLIFFGYLLFFPSIEGPPEYLPLFPAVLHMIILSYSLYLIIRTNMNTSLFKKPEFLILIGFFISYAMLIMVFFFMPILTDYSRLSANILLVVKNLISVSFYINLAYAMSISSVYNKRSN
jgi:hypothetical protein